jgi:hypothetical protein
MIFDRQTDIAQRENRAIGLCNRLARGLKEFMGQEAVADSVRVSAWRGNIMADKERVACRVDRRRS